MSADALADAVGQTRQRIDAFEAGRVDPTYDMLVALAAALRTQPSAIVALAEELTDPSES